MFRESARLTLLERGADPEGIAGAEPADATVTSRLCYRNEYDFDDATDQKDVEKLFVRVG